MPNLVVSSDVDTMLQSADNAAILSNIGAGSSTQVALNTSAIDSNESNIATNTSNIAANTSNIATNTSNISTNTANIATNTSDIADKAPKASPTFTGTVTTTKIVTREIQCEGSFASGADAQPINYDAKEHRFRDFDASPQNLMVIKKLYGKGGARIGINLNESSGDAKCALHIAHGSSDGLTREALRVSGGAFLNEWVRIGHYDDDGRDNINNPTNGTIIYNKDHHEFQGYIGGGGGSGGWKAFTLQNVST